MTTTAEQSGSVTNQRMCRYYNDADSGNLGLGVKLVYEKMAKLCFVFLPSFQYLYEWRFTTKRSIWESIVVRSNLRVQTSTAHIWDEDLTSQSNQRIDSSHTIRLILIGNGLRNDEICPNRKYEAPYSRVLRSQDVQNMRCCVMTLNRPIPCDALTFSRSTPRHAELSGPCSANANSKFLHFSGASDQKWTLPAELWLSRNPQCRPCGSRVSESETKQTWKPMRGFNCTYFTSSL